MLNYGLALAGGGTRGATHVGVLKALDEEGLLPKYIAGTSAGSITAGLYAAGMEIKEMEAVIQKLTNYGCSYLDPDFLGIMLFIPQLLGKHPIRLKGLLKGNKLLNYLCSLTDGKRIEELTRGILIPVVDLNSGRTIVYTNLPEQAPMEQVSYESSGSLCEIMMCSSSIPAIFSPRKMGKYCMVDGGVTNNLPVDLLIAAGVPNVIAVDIGADYKTLHDSSILEIASHSFSIMSRTLKDCMSSGEILLLKPKIREGAGLLTFEYMTGCMEDGYESTKKQIPRIKRALREHHVY